MKTQATKTKADIKLLYSKLVLTQRIKNLQDDLLAINKTLEKIKIE